MLSTYIGENGTSAKSTVKRLSANPSLDADVHLNPPGGMLSGTDRATAYGGWVYFRDLFVRTRGLGYKLNFEASFSFRGTTYPDSSSIWGSSSSHIESGRDGGVKLKQSTFFEVGVSMEARLLASSAVLRNVIFMGGRFPSMVELSKTRRTK